jgi:multisubunit Na+/H+ antiporter MnhF subunit
MLMSWYLSCITLMGKLLFVFHNVIVPSLYPAMRILALSTCRFALICELICEHVLTLFSFFYVVLVLVLLVKFVEQIW